jgi:hypothetical protein
MLSNSIQLCRPTSHHFLKVFLFQSGLPVLPCEEGKIFDVTVAATHTSEKVGFEEWDF